MPQASTIPSIILPVRMCGGKDTHALSGCQPEGKGDDAKRKARAVASRRSDVVVTSASAALTPSPSLHALQVEALSGQERCRHRDDDDRHNRDSRGHEQRIHAFLLIYCPATLRRRRLFCARRRRLASRSLIVRFIVSPRAKAARQTVMIAAATEKVRLSTCNSFRQHYTIQYLRLSVKG